MNAQQLIYDHLNGDYFAGDAFLCLQLAVSLQDSKKATMAGLRCMDLARHLEAKQKKDPARKPAPETVVPGQETGHSDRIQAMQNEVLGLPPDWPEAVKEIRSGNPNSAMVAEIQQSGNPGELASDPIYTWGGGRWTIIGGAVFCWNKLLQEWQESTLLPDQLKQDGTQV